MSDKAKDDTEVSSGAMAVAAKLTNCGLQKDESIRAPRDNIVKDRKTAEGLKPWYNQWCKRSLLSTMLSGTSTDPMFHLVIPMARG